MEMAYPEETVDVVAIGASVIKTQWVVYLAVVALLVLAESSSSGREEVDGKRAAQ